jgi:membrane-bound metal-dependent hydrolase YbcI (DUF457 family)
MDLFTHLIFGILMYILFLKEISFDFLIYASIFAILPDLDIFLSPLRRIFKSNYLEHRSGSHSYVIGGIISAIIGGIYSILTHQSFFIVWIIGTIFYSIHISLDLLTTTKIPCFYPISKKEYCFYVEKAGSSFTFLTSLALITTILILFEAFQNITLIFVVINIYTYFIIFYYIYRIFTKIWINSHLKENQKYLPGVLPFYYSIFEKKIENNTFSLCIKKKSHLSKEKIVYKNNAILTPLEKKFFEKARELCLKDYYYAKWTTLPIFYRNNEIFSMRFFFLEPMVNSRAMYLQYDFNLETKELLASNQSFGRFNKAF